MTDLTAHRPVAGSDARSTSLQRRRWRLANTALTATFGAAVLGISVYLGVTGPTTSPVSPPAASAVSGPADGTGATTGGTDAGTGVDATQGRQHDFGPPDRGNGFRGTGRDGGRGR